MLQNGLISHTTFPPNLKSELARVAVQQIYRVGEDGALKPALDQFEKLSEKQGARGAQPLAAPHSWPRPARKKTFGGTKSPGTLWVNHPFQTASEIDQPAGGTAAYVAKLSATTFKRQGVSDLLVLLSYIGEVVDA